MRAEIAQTILKDLLPEGSLGNVFIKFDKANHLKSKVDRKWHWHVAPLYVDPAGKAWVLEISPWVIGPMSLDAWLGFQIAFKVDVRNKYYRVHLIGTGDSRKFQVDTDAPVIKDALESSVTKMLGLFGLL